MPGQLAGEGTGRVIVLEVTGVPAPKGSGRAMLIGGKARHVPSGSSANQRALRAWTNAITAAFDALPERPAPIAGRPLRVAIAFRFARPDSHFGTGRNADRLKPSAPERPTSKPDVDKIARSTLDALTGLAFDDDARIVELVVSKGYAETIEGYGTMTGWSGARITVEEWGPASGGAT